MGRHRSPTGREATQQKGRDYVKAVIRFMDNRGYTLSDSAEVSGSKVDLEFVPKVEGRPVIAEAKHRSETGDGLSPNDFKEGFADYFLEWVNRDEKYQFHYFVGKESNDQLWKRLFREDPDSDTVEDFFEKIQEAVDEDIHEQLARYGDDLFEEFAADTTVWNYNYVELVREADRAERSGDYDYEPYLISYPSIEDQGGRLTTNLFEVAKFPPSLFRYEVEQDASPKALTRTPEAKFGPLRLHSDHLYSLYSPDDLPESADAIVVEEPDSLDFAGFAETEVEEEVNLTKSLLSGLVTTMARDAGAEIGERRDGRVTVAYLPLLGDDEELKYEGHWVAKKAERHPVVRHRAVGIDVKRLAGRYYLVFTPKQEFTTDGETLVDADQKNRLTSDFSESRFPQNRRKRSVLKDVWGDMLNPAESVLGYGERPQAGLQLVQVSGLQTDQRPPRDGEERNANIERE